MHQRLLPFFVSGLALLASPAASAQSEWTSLGFFEVSGIGMEISLLDACLTGLSVVDEAPQDDIVNDAPQDDIRGNPKAPGYLQGKGPLPLMGGSLDLLPFDAPWDRVLAPGGASLVMTFHAPVAGEVCARPTSVLLVGGKVDSLVASRRDPQTLEVVEQLAFRDVMISSVEFLKGEKRVTVSVGASLAVTRVLPGGVLDFVGEPFLDDTDAYSGGIADGTDI